MFLLAPGSEFHDIGIIVITLLNQLKRSICIKPASS